MKKTFLLGVMLALPFMASAQSATTATSSGSTVTPVTVDPGLVPGDFFYFLDQWGEGMRSFFTFGAERKAKLAMEYAHERAAEFRAVVKEHGIDAPEAKDARDGFGKEVAWAASVIAEEKAKGVDVSLLANDVGSELEQSKEVLKETYREHHDELKGTEKELRAKIQEAAKAGDKALEASLLAELEKINQDSLMTLDEEGSLEDDFDTEKSVIEEAMGAEQSAEAHITNIDRKYEQAKREAEKKGVVLDATLTAQYNDLNAKADAAFKAGDFEAAKMYAKEAQDVLHATEQNVDTKDLESEFFVDETDGAEGHMTGTNSR